MRSIIFDTDIGPDCDDVGALAMLHNFATAKRCRIAAVTHCTSNPCGAGCADAVNRWYGRPELPVGTSKRPDFLREHEKYNRYIMEHYDNRFTRRQPEDAVRVLRRALAEAVPDSVIICAVGPLNNLSELLDSKTDAICPMSGRELIESRVHRLVTMAGSETFGEYNVACDVDAARNVLENWPGEIWVSPFELGCGVMTGGFRERLSKDHIVCKAYELYTESGFRDSWDLTAVWAAAMGEGPIFSLSAPCSLKIDEKAVMNVTETEEGNARILRAVADKETIARTLDSVIDGTYRYREA